MLPNLLRLCRFQRQIIPSTERRRHHSYWAGLPPSTCTKGYRPLYSRRRKFSFTISGNGSVKIPAVLQIPVRNFCKRKAGSRYAFTESFSVTGCLACPTPYLILPMKKQRRFYCATAQNILVEMLYAISINRNFVKLLIKY